MKTIALIHTVMSVASTFGNQLKDYLGGDVRIFNIWDDFLAIDPNVTGVFSTANKYRLLQDIRNAELTGADLIVVSCSTLTPHLKAIRPLIAVPVIAIDDAMTQKAVATGSKILAVSTAESTIQPTTDKILEDAEAAGKTVSVDQKVVFEAFKAMMDGDMPKHNELLIGALENERDYDCIVLAQASMAPCAGEIENRTGIPVLSSPSLCMAYVKEALEKLD